MASFWSKFISFSHSERNGQIPVETGWNDRNGTEFWPKCFQGEGVFHFENGLIRYIPAGIGRNIPKLTTLLLWLQDVCQDPTSLHPPINTHYGQHTYDIWMWSVHKMKGLNGQLMSCNGQDFNPHSALSPLLPKLCSWNIDMLMFSNW